MPTEPISRQEYEGVLVKLTAIQGDVKLVTSSISSLEVRLNERADALKLAVDKSSEVTSERLNTVKVDIQHVRELLAPLQQRQDYNKGRDTTWQLVLVGGISAASLFITLLRTFMGH